MNAHDELTAAFRAAGWEPLPVPSEATPAPINGLYQCAYGVVGSVLAPTIQDVLGSWAQCQALLAEVLRKDAANRDCYLLFITPQIPATAMEQLNMILNDTHVCRKICVEQAGRSLAEVLGELGFLQARERDGSDSMVAVTAEVDDLGLTAEQLTDLATRSPEVIADRLLTGQYGDAEAQP